MVKKELIQLLEDRFDKLQAYLFRSYTPDEDLYSFVASVMYDKDMDECKEFNPDGTPNPQGKDLRNRAKQFLIPVVAECGGIMEDDADIKDEIRRHREAAIRFRNSAHNSNTDDKNSAELLDQAVDCDQIANWLEELLALRNSPHNG